MVEGVLFMMCQFLKSGSTEVFLYFHIDDCEVLCEWEMKLKLWDIGEFETIKCYAV